MKIKEITNYLDYRYPQELASEFDFLRIGLQIGNPDIKVKSVLLALDLTEETLQEAIDNDANLIITHHPFIFHPLHRILFNSTEGKVLEKMFNHQISLFVMHTNLDVGYLGVNDSLASKIGLLDFNADKIDAYQNNFLRYGHIKPQSLYSYAHYIKKSLNLSNVKVAGDLEKKIEKVAIIGGSGGQIEEIDRAIRLGCDLLITGEIKLNVAQYAVEREFSLIEVSHGVEKYVFDNLKRVINEEFPKLKVYISNIETDPLIFI